MIHVACIQALQPAETMGTSRLPSRNAGRRALLPSSAAEPERFSQIYHVAFTVPLRGGHWEAAPAAI